MRGGCVEDGVGLTGEVFADAEAEEGEGCFGSVSRGGGGEGGVEVFVGVVEEEGVGVRVVEGEDVGDVGEEVGGEGEVGGEAERDGGGVEGELADDRVG